MEKITLTRTQIGKLNTIVQGFPEVDYFDVIVTHETGIGPSVFVVFDYLDREDTTIEITDVSSW